MKPLNNEFLKRRGLGGGFNISLDGCCGVGWMLTFGVLGAVFCTGILAAVAELRIRSGLYTCTIILGRHLAHNWQGNSGRNQFRMTSTCAAAADVTHDRDQRTVKMSGDHLTRLLSILPSAESTIFFDFFLNSSRPFCGFGHSSSFVQTTNNTLSGF